MKISDLRDYVARNASWANAVVFGRHLATPSDETKYCIVKDDARWQVYAMERGNRIGERSFMSETDACDYLFKWIKKDAVVFGKRS